jgi:hypothetical protein
MQTMETVLDWKTWLASIAMLAILVAIQILLHTASNAASDILWPERRNRAPCKKVTAADVWNAMQRQRQAAFQS